MLKVKNQRRFNVSAREKSQAMITKLLKQIYAERKSSIEGK